MKSWLPYLLPLLVLTGCSSVSEYEFDELYFGYYGCAWEGDVEYINKRASFSDGLKHDFLDLLLSPINLTFTTATGRFLWGTNGLRNYAAVFFSILPLYSHSDAAFWYDYHILSYDGLENVEQGSTTE